MRRPPLPIISAAAFIVIIALFALARGGLTPWGTILSVLMFVAVIAAFQLMNRGPRL
jgi:hypothetical protein